ncbi:AGE family epimerase/isomerase [Marinifilum caeruleilacunae]|uniref:N-acylglucosamine 2-epimerase n=1 Tax=Marinifilum caeruleilacunae TaxID=2499076 RepID=A0ABX1WZM9_9BACT|nr:AGE family epimerase/isomerase [Marinifilum caeruleilacunae]NOU61416.1 N-acylglucosamine 2-epimerase [Marinifilum caeruleilacunae]
MSTIELEKLKTELEKELFHHVLPFWEKYSIDQQNGGYYNCLDKNGNIYDTNKYMWLHGRQVWMFSKLYNTLEKKEKWLTIATHGFEFLKKFAITENNRVYFSLNEKGEPVYMQRKIFSECFYVMAVAEYAKAIRSDELKEQSRQMFQSVLEMSQKPELINRPVYKGEPDFQNLAVPMIILNLIEEVYQHDFHLVRNMVDECIAKVKMHVVNSTVYENVLTNGELHDSSAGRLLNPGHAIEAGWFMKHWAKRLEDKDLNALSNTMITSSLDQGWDQEHGGIFYFLDAKGFSPTQLEWDRKLWWPHCEALYATLLIYAETKSQEDWKRFQMIKDYTLAHFPDHENGEWYGYLDREGKVSQHFKGGPYKGCFHVPRALFLCVELLKSLI